MSFPQMYIDNTLIGPDTDAYVIAEIGHNHQGSVDLCKRMIWAAVNAGCNAVKLQKRDNRTLYTEGFYNSPYNSENAFGPTYGTHREALEFNKAQYTELKGYADDQGITLFATAFDIPSVDFLGGLEFPALKLASGDVGNVALLEYVAKHWRKPVIFSTGGGSESAVRQAYSILNKGGSALAILQCVSGYPAAYDTLNLRVISTYRDWFPTRVIGWSGHDTGIAMAPVAYALGARIIEKHFTLDRAMKGTDQAMSLEPQGMKAMVENLRHTRLALGDGTKRELESEIEPLKKQRKNWQGQIDGRS